MIIDLTIPQTINSIIYTKVEIRKPKGNILSNTQEVTENKNVWYGMLEFIKGCTVQLLNDNGDIINQITDALIRGLYWKNIQVILIKIMSWVNKDAYVKGLYKCDMCDSGVVVKLENDNSIKYIDLEVLKGEDKIFDFTLIEPFDIKDNDNNIILSVSALSFRLATLNDLFIVESKNLKKSQKEYGALAQTIVNLNGSPIDEVVRKTWGLYIIEHCSYDDLEAISTIKDNGGIQNILELTCRNCNEKFKIEIDTDSFFLSGLQKKR